METTAPLARPLLRGWSHVVSFPVMLAVGISLIALSTVSGTGRLVLAIYVGGTAIMFGVSALYHRVPWQPRARAIAQRFDHSAIFLAIAGGYTPVAALCLEGRLRLAVLAGVWVGSLAGMALVWIPSVHRAWKGASYIVVSWVAAIALPDLARGLGTTGFVLILAGGVCYTIGAAAFAAHWPDPWPRVFGFHEIFHAFTIVAASLQFTAMAVVVAPRLSA